MPVRPHSMRGGRCNPHRLSLSMLDQTPYRTKRQFAPTEHCHQSKAVPACRHLLSARYLRYVRWPQCYLRQSSGDDRAHHRRHGKDAPGPQHRCCLLRRRSSGDDRENHRRHVKGAPGPQHRCCQRRQRSSGDDRATHRRLERAQRLQLHRLQFCRLQFHRPKTVQTMKLKHPQRRRRRPRRDGCPHPCLT